MKWYKIKKSLFLIIKIYPEGNIKKGNKSKINWKTLWAGEEMKKKKNYKKINIKGVVPFNKFVKISFFGK